MTAAVVAALCAAPETSASAAAAPHFRNCTAMHQAAHGKYKGGIAKRGAHDKRKSGHARYKPYVNTAYYNANHGLDRDHDGIACEQ